MALVAVRDDAPQLEREAESDGEVDEEEAGEFLRRGSNIERMETALDTYKIKALELLADQGSSSIIRREVFRQVVKTQRQRFYGCLSLPFSLLFFLLFAQATFLHEDITNVYIVESGLLSVLGEGAEELESVEDAWGWLNGVLVPRLFDQPGEDKGLWSRVLTYNVLTGPLVLEQLRSEAELCQGGEGLTGSMTCYPMRTRSRSAFGRSTAMAVPPPLPGDYAGGNATADQREAYWNSAFQAQAGRRLRFTRPELRAALPGGLPTDDAYRAYLYPNTRQGLVLGHLAYLRERGWLDAQTKQLKVKALLLNAEVGRPRLEQLVMTIAFSRAGGLFVRVGLETLFLRFWADELSGVVDAFWLLMLTFVTAVQFWSLAKGCARGEVRRSCSSSWSLLQWAIVICGWLCVFMYLGQGVMMDTVTKLYQDMISHQLRDLPAETNVLGAEMHDEVDWMTYYNSWVRIFLALYHLLLMIRFFTAFAAQPRLGVVISALEASLIDVVHFLVVVLPTFMAYAVCGCFIFGRRMEDFASFESAMGVCFKIFIETEYDWPDLTEEHYWTAAGWTWSFMFLLVMLMLNMVLAIVLDVYTEIRKSSGQSETVWTTLVHMVQQLWHRRAWISNRELLDGVPPEGEPVSRDELLGAFPGMCTAQVNMLMAACRYQVEVAALGDSAAENDSKKMAMSIKVMTDQISEKLQQLHEGLADADASAEAEDQEGQGSWIHRLDKEMARQNHAMLGLQWRLQQLQWQWQALEAVHGPGTRFTAQQKVPEARKGAVL